MNADRLGRFELLMTWTQKLNELARTGESTRQLERFLRTVEALPGEEVGEIGNEWRRRQREQRPCWALAYLMLAVLVATAAGHFLGTLFAGLSISVISLCAAKALHHHWQQEEAFDHELHTRATYVVNRPVWGRSV
ncbi:hypothetical protein JST97_12895 [bacterium]|nr:hypothetical protein [bacterium]